MAAWIVHRGYHIEVVTEALYEGFRATYRIYGHGVDPRAGAAPIDSGRCGPLPTEAAAMQQAEERAKARIDEQIDPLPRRGR